MSGMKIKKQHKQPYQKKILDYLKLKGVKKHTFAQLLGVTPQSLSRYLAAPGTDNSRTPKPKYANKIVDIINKDLGYDAISLNDIYKRKEHLDRSPLCK